MREREELLGQWLQQTSRLLCASLGLNLLLATLACRNASVGTAPVADTALQLRRLEDVPCACSRSVNKTWSAKRDSVPSTRVPFGIYPVMREFDCGHKNLELPRALLRQGKGRILVDVGLSAKPKETIQAMENGFNVLGFELEPRNFNVIAKEYGNHPRVKMVRLRHDGIRWQLPRWVTAPPSLSATGQGTAYIIHAGCDRASGSAHVVGSGAGAGVASRESLGSGSKITPHSVPLVALDDILPSWAEVCAL